MFAAADQITGWSGLVRGGGEQAEFGARRGVTGGLQRARVVAAEVGWVVMT